MTTLQDLPTEILFNILSFCSPFDATLVPLQPLYVLAATNKHLNSVVEEYARGLLKQHTKATPPKKSKKATQRRTWIKWLAETCQLCGKNSKRQAILDPSLTCCQTCDRKHFPKCTMTKAQEKYNLSKLDIFTPSVLHPNLPPLAAGTYVCMGSDTTMISESDLLSRRDYIHSLLGERATSATYMRRRKAAHNRIAEHLGLHISSDNLNWAPKPIFSRAHWSESMTTEAKRVAYVRKNLGKEWREMGVKGLEFPSRTYVPHDGEE